VSGFQHIIEPEPDPEPETYTAGPRGKATIIRGPGKCKRLHADWVWIFLGALAASGLALGGASLFLLATSR